MNNQEKILRAKELLDQKLSQRAVAKELDVDHRAIRYWINKNFLLDQNIQAIYI